MYRLTHLCTLHETLTDSKDQQSCKFATADSVLNIDCAHIVSICCILIYAIACSGHSCSTLRVRTEQAQKQHPLQHKSQLGRIAQDQVLIAFKAAVDILSIQGLKTRRKLNGIDILSKHVHCTPFADITYNTPLYRMQDSYTHNTWDFSDCMKLSASS